MDGSQFDDLLRAFTNSRRTVIASALALVGAQVAGPITAAKKKKKKCAQKCQAGCCTGKYGKCLQPTQQSPTQCGTGGEICRGNCGTGGGCGSCPAGQICQGGKCVKPTCTPACAGKPPCSSDGCGGICQTCGAGQSCQNGACACPADKPHFCNNRCQECCGPDHCPKYGAQECDVDGTGLCTCWEGLHMCEDGGLCWDCCADGHFRGFGRAPEDGFYCKLENHSCICGEGTSECVKPDGSGELYCVNLQENDQSCGSCNFDCTYGGTPFHCERGTCVRNE